MKRFNLSLLLIFLSCFAQSSFAQTETGSGQGFYEKDGDTSLEDALVNSNLTVEEKYQEIEKAVEDLDTPAVINGKMSMPEFIESRFLSNSYIEKPVLKALKDVLEQQTNDKQYSDLITKIDTKIKTEAMDKDRLRKAFKESVKAYKNEKNSEEKTKIIEEFVQELKKSATKKSATKEKQSTQEILKEIKDSKPKKGLKGLVDKAKQLIKTTKRTLGFGDGPFLKAVSNSLEFQQSPEENNSSNNPTKEQEQKIKERTEEKKVADQLKAEEKALDSALTVSEITGNTLQNGPGFEQEIKKILAATPTVYERNKLVQQLKDYARTKITNESIQNQVDALIDGTNQEVTAQEKAVTDKMYNDIVVYNLQQSEKTFESIRELIATYAEETKMTPEEAADVLNSRFQEESKNKPFRNIYLYEKTMDEIVASVKKNPPAVNPEVKLPEPKEERSTTTTNSKPDQEPEDQSKTQPQEAKETPEEKALQNLVKEIKEYIDSAAVEYSKPENISDTSETLTKKLNKLKVAVKNYATLIGKSEEEAFKEAVENVQQDQISQPISRKIPYYSDYSNLATIDLKLKFETDPTKQEELESNKKEINKTLKKEKIKTMTPEEQVAQFEELFREYQAAENDQDKKRLIEEASNYVETVEKVKNERSFHQTFVDFFKRIGSHKSFKKFTEEAQQNTKTEKDKNPADQLSGAIRQDEENITEAEEKETVSHADDATRTTSVFERIKHKVKDTLSKLNPFKTKNNTTDSVINQQPQTGSEEEEAAARRQQEEADAKGKGKSKSGYEKPNGEVK